VTDNNDVGDASSDGAGAAGAGRTPGGARSRAKRHHHVAQFYLRGFADADEKLTTVRLPGDKRFTQVVRKAASETNFYKVEGHVDGDDVFEKIFSGVEGEAAEISESIVAGVWPLPEKERMALSSYIAFQAVRGPEQRKNMEHIRAQFTRLEVGAGGRAGVKGWAKRTRGVDVTDEEAELIWEQATQPGGPPIRIAPQAHILQIAEMNEQLTSYISGRPWTLFEFDRRSLITSDTPVGLVQHPPSEDGSDSERGVGYMTAWGITFPLTRKLGLVMSDPMVFGGKVPVELVRAGQFDHKEEGTTSYEKFINFYTSISASEWLYHHPDDARFVPDNLPEPSPVTMRVSGGPETFSGEPFFMPKHESEQAPDDAPIPPER
jgi:hypothetical protein